MANKTEIRFLIGVTPFNALGPMLAPRVEYDMITARRNSSKTWGNAVKKLSKLPGIPQGEPSIGYADLRLKAWRGEFWYNLTRYAIHKVTLFFEDDGSYCGYDINPLVCYEQDSKQ